MAENKEIDEAKILVKEGYNAIAEIHDGFADKNISQLEIFKQFIKLVGNKKRILELGCGSGFMGDYFLTNKYFYTGIDFSESQIELAIKNLPNHKSNFKLAEMQSYCNSLPSNSADGIIALFSIFHLPKSQHLELFRDIKSILTKESPVLFTAADSESEGTEDNWIGGGKTMYWSNYPYTWYEEKLPEIGFKHINTFRREFEFANEIEIQYFLLFQA